MRYYEKVYSIEAHNYKTIMEILFKSQRQVNLMKFLLEREAIKINISLVCFHELLHKVDILLSFYIFWVISISSLKV